MKKILIVAAAFGLTACQPAVYEDTLQPVTPVLSPDAPAAPKYVPQARIVGQYGYGEVWRMCDGPRAIYTSKSGYSGGIAVVENAAECAQ